MGMYADAAAALADGCLHNWKCDSGEGDSTILDAIGNYDGGIVAGFTGNAANTLEVTNLGHGRRHKMGPNNPTDYATLECDPVAAGLSSTLYYNATARIRLKYTTLEAWYSEPLCIGDRNNNTGSCCLFLRNLSGSQMTARWSRPANVIDINIAPDASGYVELVATSEGDANGCTLKLYANGVFKGSSTVSAGRGGMNFYGSVMRFGAGVGSDNVYYTDGVVDDIAVWNRTLNATEISALYNQSVITSIVGVEQTANWPWMITNAVLNETSLLWDQAQYVLNYPPVADLRALVKPVQYRAKLTGANDATTDIYLPISSFNSRLRSGRDSYLSIVVPHGEQYIGPIEARPNGELILEQVQDGVAEELSRSNFDELRIDKGSRVGTTLTLTGYRQKTYTLPNTWNYTSHSYYSRGGGKSRVRMQMNTAVRPNDSVTVEGTTFIVDTVTLIGSPRRTYMELSE